MNNYCTCNALQTKGHPDIKAGWPKCDTRSALADIITTMAWIGSGHHSAINFNQYDFSSLLTVRSTFMRRPIPQPGSTEAKVGAMLSPPPPPQYPLPFPYPHPLVPNTTPPHPIHPVLRESVGVYWVDFMICLPPPPTPPRHGLPPTSSILGWCWGSACAMHLCGLRENTAHSPLTVQNTSMTPNSFLKWGEGVETCMNPWVKVLICVFLASLGIVYYNGG